MYVVHSVVDEGDSLISGHLVHDWRLLIGSRLDDHVVVVQIGLLLWLDLDVLLVLAQLVSLSGSLIFFIWWKKERVLSLDRESESSVSGDDSHWDLFDLDHLVDGWLHLMPLRCRRDRRIRLAGTGAILLPTEIDELDVTMIDGVCLADLVGESCNASFSLTLFCQAVYSACALSAVSCWSLMAPRVQRR